MARRFRDVFGHAVASADNHVDLWACAAQQLWPTGCQVEKIHRYCTFCESEGFFSQRRDGRRTGRQGVLGFATTPTDYTPLIVDLDELSSPDVAGFNSV